MRKLVIFLCVVLNLSAAQMPQKALYLEGQSTTGIILAHGGGMDPDFKVVKPLRLALHEDLDFHTLSLQMPINHKDYKDYEQEQDKVNSMIQEAIAFLHAKGVKKIYLMGHSLGAGMTSGFLVSHPDTAIAAYIAVGCRANESKVISCHDNIREISLPVFDVWGDANQEDSAYGKKREDLVGDRYTQYSIDGANHVLDGANEFFVEEVEAWLEEN